MYDKNPIINIICAFLDRKAFTEIIILCKYRNFDTFQVIFILSIFLLSIILYIGFFFTFFSLSLFFFFVMFACSLYHTYQTNTEDIASQNHNYV